MTPDELARACASAMWANDSASQGVDMTLDHVGPSSATLSIMLRPDMVNGHGLCHGSFIFTLADSAFAFACNATNRRAVASAVIRAEAGRSALYDVRVTTDSGTLIAEFRGHCRTLGSKFFPDLPDPAP